MAQAQEWSDGPWVLAAARGDHAAMSALYGRYAPVVHGVLLSRVGSAEADDLTQDVFIRAMRGISGLRDPQAFGAWICVMARNEAARSIKRRVRGALRLVGLAQRGSTEAPRPGLTLEAGEIMDVVRSLPEAYRETLVLRLVEGLTGPEIAARTGMTHGSVRVNLTRGMKMLRERLDAAGGVP